MACAQVQVQQPRQCRWDGCSQQDPSIQVGRSECGNLQAEDRNGVWTSRDEQGSDSELGGGRAKSATEQGKRATGGVAGSYRSKRSVELTPVESIRRIINRSSGCCCEATAVLAG